ncbi:MAG: HNH endonuclease [Bacteroidetes bacterium]|nr:HNH endonuclease [Bacteroidota bacterium]
MPPTQKKSIPKILKDLTWQRWIGDDIAKAKCLCCGINEIKMNSFHCGHVVSEAMGGPTTVDNLRPVCATCNLSMKTQNMEKFKGQHGLGVTPNSFRIEDGHIRASTRLGSTDLSISVPISTVVQMVKNLVTT